MHLVGVRMEAELVERIGAVAERMGWDRSRTIRELLGFSVGLLEEYPRLLAAPGARELSRGREHLARYQAVLLAGATRAEAVLSGYELEVLIGICRRLEWSGAGIRHLPADAIAELQRAEDETALSDVELHAMIRRLRGLPLCSWAAIAYASELWHPELEGALLPLQSLRESLRR